MRVAAAELTCWSPCQITLTCLQVAGPCCPGAQQQQKLCKTLHAADLEAVAAPSNASVSPMRRARKAELMAYALGQSPGSSGTSPGLLLGLDMREQQLVRMLVCHSSSGVSCIIEATTSSVHPHTTAHHCRYLWWQQQQLSHPAGVLACRLQQFLVAVLTAAPQLGCRNLAF